MPCCAVKFDLRFVIINFGPKNMVLLSGLSQESSTNSFLSSLLAHGCGHKKHCHGVECGGAIGRRCMCRGGGGMTLQQWQLAAQLAGAKLSSQWTAFPLGPVI